jgi:signal transduction histidine kinase
MSTQLILTIILIFVSFFTLQFILNFRFFEGYYTNEEYERVHSELIAYVDAMNEDDADYYDEMYTYTSDKNVYSIITTRNYVLKGSFYSQFIIEVEDSSTNELHTFLVPEINYEYVIGEDISVDAYEYTEASLSPIKIVTADYSFDNGVSCVPEDDCISIEGTVTRIEKPSNLNIKYEYSLILQQEINKLSTDTIKLDEHIYEDGYHYISEHNNTRYLVFIHELGTFDFIVTAIPIQNASGIIAIMNNYNNFVYLTAIAIIFLWSFRLTSIISKPVQNIESVAREISDLNFNIEAHAYNNKENTSLSKSINLISRNLKETLDTLNAQNDELTNLYDEQVKQVSLKKQLVSSISHELKTPLMIMQVTIQAILDGIIPEEEAQKEMNNVLDEISKSSMMIQDMLQIYRLEDANTKLEVTEFNLSEAVKFFISDFENVLRKHNFELETEITKSVMIEADDKLISRCISNFFTNAIRYTPDNGKIKIKVTNREDCAYFELINYGVNIPDEDLENIWIPFFKGQNNSKDQKLRTKGSGIGLYLVSEILKAHHAEFDITNIDNGVKAYFKLQKKQIN